MPKLHFDWERDLNKIDTDKESSVSVQNIVAITERLILVEDAIAAGESYEGYSIPFAELLAEVLRDELEKEYAYRDLFEKIAAMKELGVT